MAKGVGRGHVGGPANLLLGRFALAGILKVLITFKFQTSAPPANPPGAGFPKVFNALAPP